MQEPLITNCDHQRMMTSGYVKVGLLSCQQHVFLRTLRSVVVSCTRVPSSPKAQGKSSDAYHIVCEDSVLFPRGGGQPCDYGWLFPSEEALNHSMAKEKAARAGGVECLSSFNEGGIYVTEVEREGDCCVMTIPEPVEVGSVVWQKVDWERRLDNMQHHTGQHLLTSVVEDIMGLPTTSVAFAFPFSYIQIDISPYLNREAHADPHHPLLPPGAITKDKQIASHVIRMMEERCNELIRDENSSVTITIYPEREDLQAAMNNSSSRFRSRRIPEDVTGPFRTITINNVDQCTCCGTHLEHLRQLQVLHILPHQDVKNSIIKLYFVVGERARKYFSEMYARERQLILQLSGCRPENFINELQERSRITVQAEKKIKQWSTELAEMQATLILSTLPKENQEQQVVVHRRDDVDMDYFIAFRAAMDRLGYEKTLLVAGWLPEPNASSSPNSPKGPQGQVLVSVGGGVSMMPKKEKKGSKAAVENVQENVELEAIKARFQLVTKVVQDTLEDIKGGVSQQGFRGKGSLNRWDEMEAAVMGAFQM